MKSAVYHIERTNNFSACSMGDNCPNAANHLTEKAKTNLQNDRPKTDLEFKLWIRLRTRNNQPRPITDSELTALLLNQNPYTSWHPEIIKLKEEYPQLKFGSSASASSGSVRFQIINFLAYHPHFAFNRAHLNEIRNVLCKGKEETGDVIQHINKVDQGGLAWDKLTVKGGPYYGLFSIRFIGKYISSRVDLVDTATKQIETERIRQLFRDLSEGDFEQGHKDPRLPLTVENTIMQPTSINRSHRDDYIFDDNGLPKIPNPEKFAQNPKRFYPSAIDRKLLWESLNKEFKNL